MSVEKIVVKVPSLDQVSQAMEVCSVLVQQVVAVDLEVVAVGRRPYSIYRPGRPLAAAVVVDPGQSVLAEIVVSS